MSTMPDPANELTRNQQPPVYVVDRNPESNEAVDLHKLLAPIWRWRWIELALLLLTLFAASWYYMREADSNWEIIISPGSNDFAMVISQMEQVVIPGAVQDIEGDWKPIVDISPTSMSLLSTDDSMANPELVTISFSTSRGTDELHASLADSLRQRIQSVSTRLAVVTSVEQTSALQALTHTIEKQETALSLISEPDYVAALRGRLETNISMTRAAITKQTVLDDQLTARELFLGDRAIALDSTLESLLASLNSANNASSGTQQLLADRIATIRLELEQRIPTERLELLGRLGACRAEQASLNARLMQQVLESVNFISDLAVQQEAVQTKVENAKAARDLFQAKMQATLIHQPLAVVEQFHRAMPRDQHIIMTIAILILGGIASLFAAYVLEVLRIARLGTLAG
ncbi:MAG: hypothetical protein P8I91_08345 [Phycisphaerales bacterium]|nr:hypothetical protein [Phycisphaerales bacterium]